MERNFENLLDKINEEFEDYKSDKGLTTNDQAFGFWVAEHILQVDSNDAEIGVPGHEHGIDILTIDHQKKEIIISQVKWSDKLEHNLLTAEIDKLSNAPIFLYDKEVTGNKIFDGKKDDFRDAIDGVDEYTIHLQLILAGIFTSDQISKIESLNGSSKKIGVKDFNIKYVSFDKSKLYDIVYRPDTPDITLKIESTMEFENRNRRDMFIIIKGVELNEKVRKEDYIVLFQYNPRFYLGMSEQDDADINSGIKKTAIDNEESKNFLEYNNGITCVCDTFELEEKLLTADDEEFVGEEESEIESSSTKTQRLLHIKNLKIVNGCQTVVSLGNAGKNVKEDVYILCKLYEIKKNLDSEIDEEQGDLKGELKRNISKFTNSQNRISIRDMASDQPRQISIQQYIDNNYEKFFWERKSGERKLYNTDPVWERKHKPMSFRIINNFKAAKYVYVWYYEKPYESVMLKETQIFDEKDPINKEIFNYIPIKELILSWILDQILSKTLSYMKKPENINNLESHIKNYDYEADSVIKLVNSQYAKANCLAIMHHFLKKNPKYDEIINAIITLMLKTNNHKFPDEHEHIRPIFLCIMQYFDTYFREKYFNGENLTNFDAKDIKICFESKTEFTEILNKFISNDKSLDGKITDTLNGYFENILTESQK